MHSITRPERILRLKDRLCNQELSTASKSASRFRRDTFMKPFGVTGVEPSAGQSTKVTRIFTCALSKNTFGVLGVLLLKPSSSEIFRALSCL